MSSIHRLEVKPPVAHKAIMFKVALLPLALVISDDTSAIEVV
jgi:hypothetical protein